MTAWALKGWLDARLRVADIDSLFHGVKHGYTLRLLTAAEFDALAVDKASADDGIAEGVLWILQLCKGVVTQALARAEVWYNLQEAQAET